MLIKAIRLLRRNRKRKVEDRQVQDLITHLKTLPSARLLVVDLGFNTGDIYAAIRAQGVQAKYVGFEIQQDLCAQAAKIDDPHLQVIHAAANNKNGEISYFEPLMWSKNHKGGSTIMAGKSGAAAEAITAPSIDFAQWLGEHTDKDDIVFLKIDIEGAEFDLLEHLIDEQMLDSVSGLAIEWHSSKFGLENEAQYLSRKADIELAIWQRGLDYLEWF